MEHEITGIVSGDYESFCFDVSKEEWKKIRGEEPRNADKSFFNKDCYRIYLTDLFPILFGRWRVEDPILVSKFKISIEADTVKEIPPPEENPLYEKELNEWLDDEIEKDIG